jgi:hypothetical protein
MAAKPPTATPRKNRPAPRDRAGLASPGYSLACTLPSLLKQTGDCNVGCRGDGCDIVADEQYLACPAAAILVIAGNHHGATYIVRASAVNALRESGSR